MTISSIKVVLSKRQNQVIEVISNIFRKGQIDIKSSNVQSEADFKSALEIDKWSKGKSKKTFKTSTSFPGKSNYNIAIGLPQSFQTFPMCAVPYAHPIPFSKYIQYEELPDASGWDDDDNVMEICGPNWCSWLFQSLLSRSLLLRSRSWDMTILMMKIHIYRKWLFVIYTTFLSSVVKNL